MYFSWWWVCSQRGHVLTNKTGTFKQFGAELEKLPEWHTHTHTQPNKPQKPQVCHSVWQLQKHQFNSVMTLLFCFIKKMGAKSCMADYFKLTFKAPVWKREKKDLELFFQFVFLILVFWHIHTRFRRAWLKHSTAPHTAVTSTAKHTHTHCFFFYFSSHFWGWTAPTAVWFPQNKPRHSDTVILQSVHASNGSTVLSYCVKKATLFTFTPPLSLHLLLSLSLSHTLKHTRADCFHVWLPNPRGRQGGIMIIIKKRTDGGGLSYRFAVVVVHEWAACHPGDGVRTIHRSSPPQKEEEEETLLFLPFLALSLCFRVPLCFCFFMLLLFLLA